LEIIGCLKVFFVTGCRQKYLHILEEEANKRSAAACTLAVARTVTNPGRAPGGARFFNRNLLEISTQHVRHLAPRKAIPSRASNVSDELRRWIVRLSSRMHARRNVERTSEAQVRHATPLCEPTGTAGGCGPRRGEHRREKQDRDADTVRWGRESRPLLVSEFSSSEGHIRHGRDISAEAQTSATQTQSF